MVTWITAETPKVPADALMANSHERSHVAMASGNASPAWGTMRRFVLAGIGAWPRLR